MNKKLLQSLRNSEELLTQWNALTPALTHLFWLITNNDYATPQGGTKFQVIEDFKDFYRNRKVQLLISKMTQQKEDLKKLAQAYFTVDNNLSTVSLLEATTIHAQIGEMIKKLDSAIELNHSMISEIKAKKAKIKNSANTIEAYADTLLQAYESSNDRIKESARHGKTWDELSERLHSISNIFSLETDKFSSNQLSLLLQPNDALFLDSLLSPNRNRLYGDSGELAHIIVARLKEMYKHVDPNNRVTTERINAAIYYIKNPKNFDNNKTIFDYDKNELKSEVMKLLLHSTMNEGSKTIIIGTASSVVRENTLHPGEAMYLNCSDNQWSWGLNRAYFEIAKTLGYQIKIVDPQFPHIEQAILSGNPAALLVELVREIRPSDLENNSTQYHGGDQPTATPLECLAIMDSGFIAERKDGLVVFNPRPKQEHELRRSFLTMSTSIGRARSHSAEPVLRSETRNPDSVRTHREHDPFFVPGDSLSIRLQASHQSPKPPSIKADVDHEMNVELITLMMTCDDLIKSIQSAQKKIKNQSTDNPAVELQLTKTENELLMIKNLLGVALKNIGLGIYDISAKENYGGKFIDKLCSHAEKVMEQSKITLKLQEDKSPARFHAGRRHSISND